MSRILQRLEVIERPIADLKPYARNPRTHSKKQLGQIADSIQKFGWTNPILIDAKAGVIAGHGRLEAAKTLGLEMVPTIRIENLTEVQKRAYILADNKLAENAGWDKELLALEIEGLAELDPSFDITVTGFEMGEIDLLMSGIGSDDEADVIPNIEDISPVSQVGDLWQLGAHRVLCGDALKRASYETLLDGEKAQLVFSDPPFNVPIDGHVSGLGAIKHGEFAMASGEMSEAEFMDFLKIALGNMAAHSKDGAIHFICMDWRHLYELLDVGRSVYSELKNLCVWNKNNGGMGSLYRSKHELVAVFKKGTEPHINNVDLGRYGRYRTNVWDYAGINSFGADRDEALAMHPTVKPVALVEDAILDCSNRGGIVLDAFGGSGTTIMAAERAGRRGFAMEYEPLYVDVTLKRFRDLTGEEPVHVESGLKLKELE